MTQHKSEFVANEQWDTLQEKCYFSTISHRVVPEEEVAPLVLDIEEQGEHDHDVDEGDEGHNHQSTVHFLPKHK